MTKKKYCCKTMEDAINDEVILVSYNQTLFEIWGKPTFTPDGSGCMDNITDQYNIGYCPFCGKKLLEVIP